METTRSGGGFVWEEIDDGPSLVASSEPSVAPQHAIDEKPQSQALHASSHRFLLLAAALLLATACPTLAGGGGGRCNTSAACTASRTLHRWLFGRQSPATKRPCASRPRAGSRRRPRPCFPLRSSLTMAWWPTDAACCNGVSKAACVSDEARWPACCKRPLVRRPRRSLRQRPSCRPSYPYPSWPAPSCASCPSSSRRRRPRRRAAAAGPYSGSVLEAVGMGSEIISSFAIRQDSRRAAPCRQPHHLTLSFATGKGARHK